MKKQALDPQYAPLIKGIRRKRRNIIVLTVIAILIIVLFISPLQWYVFGSTIIQYNGLYPYITVSLVLMSLFVELIAYSLVSIPLTASLDEECDPEKHMKLNTALIKEKQAYYIYTADHFFLGEYDVAREYAEKMINDKNQIRKITGWFEKARCEFMCENREALKEAAEGYALAMSSLKSKKAKAVEPYNKMKTVIDLMCAILDDDAARIELYRRSVESWAKTKIADGFVNYVRGVAACLVADKGEAIYRLMSVKEKCAKTVLSPKSDEHLALLKW